jgi:hypothetical protein
MGQQDAAVGDAAPPASRALTRDERDVAIVRKMWLGGLLLLPWLWIMCLLKYRKRLFDRDAPPALRWCEWSPRRL